MRAKNGELSCHGNLTVVLTSAVVLPGYKVFLHLDLIPIHLFVGFSYNKNGKS